MEDFWNIESIGNISLQVNSSLFDPEIEAIKIVTVYWNYRCIVRFVLGEETRLII